MTAPNEMQSTAKAEVAVLLQLSKDDPRLQSVGKMLQTFRVRNAGPWIAALARKGELLSALEKAHSGSAAHEVKTDSPDTHKCVHGVVNGLRAHQCVQCEDLTVTS